jgi:hypothetical protein
VFAKWKGHLAAAISLWSALTLSTPTISSRLFPSHVQWKAHRRDVLPNLHAITEFEVSSRNPIKGRRFRLTRTTPMFNLD